MRSDAFAYTFFYASAEIWCDQASRLLKNLFDSILCCCYRNNGFEEEESPISDDRTPSEDAERYPSLNPMEGMTGQTSIEKRIIAKIADICSPGKTGTSSKLLQQAQVKVLTCLSADVEVAFYEMDRVVANLNCTLIISGKCSS